MVIAILSFVAADCLLAMISAPVVPQHRIKQSVRQRGATQKI